MHFHFHLHSFHATLNLFSQLSFPPSCLIAFPPHHITLTHKTNNVIKIWNSISLSLHNVWPKKLIEIVMITLFNEQQSYDRALFRWLIKKATVTVTIRVPHVRVKLVDVFGADFIIKRASFVYISVSKACCSPINRRPSF